MDPARARLAARYVRFANEEAHGRSPRYGVLCHGVAGVAAVLAFLPK
jgi:hypothetical protein